MPLVTVVVAGVIASASPSLSSNVEIVGPSYCGHRVQVASSVAKYRKEVFKGKRNPMQRVVDMYQHLPYFHAWLQALNDGHMRAPEAETKTLDKCIAKEIE